MRTGNAEEARLKKLYQEADNERMQLRERVCWLESEDEIQCKRSHELQVQNAELKQQLEHARRELLRSQEQAAKWEARFDTLLQATRGDVSTNDTKWRELIQKMHGWMVPKET